ncbi:hypothetical protein SNOG_10019 [Parastagonospora nodorum SN15]|uniref:Uncharacterized protein n=1 Tax=Phaeosphaeria nodorum (strain SN15 / ATCC MYA-4574 / FGSC 10173) TaxID=321614 RepID=Q0UDZ5_PHANO|nr:hypothetical protein SNOG_10019 [Parastagonospora nodorum SN15]EAT82354.1 hypothetical protein SNOG_10019 [Parastagonospora nodorum SN15]
MARSVCEAVSSGSVAHPMRVVENTAETTATTARDGRGQTRRRTSLGMPLAVVIAARQISANRAPPEAAADALLPVQGATTTDNDDAVWQRTDTQDH